MENSEPHRMFPIANAESERQEYAIAQCWRQKEAAIFQVSMVGGLFSRLQTLLLEVPLFAEYTATHLEHSFEPFAATLSVLAESLHTCFFDLIFDFLPTTTEGGDLRLLVELGGRSWVEEGRLVDYGLAHIENVRPGEVGRAHSHFLRSRIDVGDLIDVRGGTASEERKDPLRYRLVAGNETLGS